MLSLALCLVKTREREEKRKEMEIKELCLICKREKIGNMIFMWSP